MMREVENATTIRVHQIAPLMVVFIKGRSCPLYCPEGVPIEDVIAPGQAPLLPSPRVSCEIQSSTALPPVSVAMSRWVSQRLSSEHPSRQIDIVVGFDLP
jgi:hypothetical protein